MPWHRKRTRVCTGHNTEYCAADIGGALHNPYERSALKKHVSPSRTRAIAAIPPARDLGSALKNTHGSLTFVRTIRRTWSHHVPLAGWSENVPRVVEPGRVPIEQGRKDAVRAVTRPSARPRSVLRNPHHFPIGCADESERRVALPAGVSLGDDRKRSPTPVIVLLKQCRGMGRAIGVGRETDNTGGTINKAIQCLGAYSRKTRPYNSLL